MTWTLTLPREVQSGNALAYRHWRVRHADKTAWVSMLSIVLLRGVKIPPATGKRRVEITAYRKRTLDDDNMVSGCKHLRDALINVGLIKDDNAKCAEFVYRQALRSARTDKKPCTVLTITDIPEKP